MNRQQRRAERHKRGRAYFTDHGKAMVRAWSDALIARAAEGATSPEAAAHYEALGLFIDGRIHLGNTARWLIENGHSDLPYDATVFAFAAAARGAYPDKPADELFADRVGHDG